MDSCRTSVDELDRLCSFAMAPPDDHLDLGWILAKRLGRCCALASWPVSILMPWRAFRRALTGDEEVSPAYRDPPRIVWEHPVTALRPVVVAMVAPLVRQVGAVMMTALAASDGEITAAIRELPPDADFPQEYMIRHLTALLDSYKGAAERGLAIVL